MGFWARDRMEQLGLPEPVIDNFVPPPPRFPCPDCGIVFESTTELALHSFRGHFSPRPVIVAQGRELGASRLVVTATTEPHDWVFHHVDLVELNGEVLSTADAADRLASRTVGVVDIVATSRGHEPLAQVEFALPTKHDLDGVDAALRHFVHGGELTRPAIIDFIDRGRSFSTAGRYLDGLSSYLFGLLWVEDAADGSRAGEAAEQYTARFDTAVTELGRRGDLRPRRVPLQPVQARDAEDEEPVGSFGLSQVQRAAQPPHDTRSRFTARRPVLGIRSRSQRHAYGAGARVRISSG
jgi:hypothetical protein